MLPAIWPALVVGIVLVFARNTVPLSLAAVLAQMMLGGLLYLALFILAIGTHDRAMYTAKVLELCGRRLVPAA
jgi:hypothetical protein